MIQIVREFKFRFPFFDSKTVDQMLPILIPEYKFYYNHDYNEETRLPILYCLAHIFYLETQISESMVPDDFANLKPHYPMNSEQMGDLSASYDISTDFSTGFSDYFKTTQYGQRFLNIIRSDRGVSCV